MLPWAAVMWRGLGVTQWVLYASSNGLDGNSDMPPAPYSHLYTGSEPEPKSQPFKPITVPTRQYSAQCRSCYLPAACLIHLQR